MDVVTPVQRDIKMINDWENLLGIKFPPLEYETVDVDVFEKHIPPLLKMSSTLVEEKEQSQDVLGFQSLSMDVQRRILTESSLGAPSLSKELYDPRYRVHDNCRTGIRRREIDDWLNSLPRGTNVNGLRILILSEVSSELSAVFFEVSFNITQSKGLKSSECFSTGFGENKDMGMINIQTPSSLIDVLMDRYYESGWDNIISIISDDITLTHVLNRRLSCIQRDNGFVQKYMRDLIMESVYFISYPSIMIMFFMLFSPLSEVVLQSETVGVKYLTYQQLYDTYIIISKILGHIGQLDEVENLVIGHENIDISNYILDLIQKYSTQTPIVATLTEYYNLGVISPDEAIRYSLVTNYINMFGPLLIRMNTHINK